LRGLERKGRNAPTMNFERNDVEKKKKTSPLGREKGGGGGEFSPLRRKGLRGGR